MGLLCRVNRDSKQEVSMKGEQIFCPLCLTRSKVIARRDTIWLSLFTIKILEVKRMKVYPACSHCYNQLPTQFILCPICKYILPSVDMFCYQCQANPA
ncbi:hypothetical protein NEHOM01_0441 [Nematocida homosporus]|uniref:uncharacterized protein n=1 Tax=Nematocida homosporus TaxID=1912981 RepID=UPI0022205A1A|nr:uncharacterized protein NEHOM01_0441 [Nematocida homosporus]KAI5184890.1 hypothetical protein NEHOM01_0441 [Nematocida homosporus]